MGNPNPKHKFAKGNDLGRTMLKGKPKKKTIVKNRLKEIATWDTVETVVEQNIMELLRSKDKKTKMEATKAFAEFIKPKKREKVNEFKGNLVLRIVGLEEGDF